MAKLGYTWYPKDWGNSESVFELSLSERGLYREFIDLAMMNDNKTEIKKTVWCRKFCVSIEDLEIILSKLLSLKLIEYKKDILFIPSCESRLNMVRGGSKGGKNKPTVKGNDKPIVKPISSLSENNDKPIVNQREIETKKESETETKNKTKNDFIYEELILSEDWINVVSMNSKNKFTPNEVKINLEKYNTTINSQFDFKNNKTEYCSHFTRWLDKQTKNGHLPNQAKWISPA